MEQQMTHQQTKIDATELAALLNRLPEEEKFKIFYMMKGIELRNENKKAPLRLRSEENQPLER